MRGQDRVKPSPRAGEIVGGCLHDVAMATIRKEIEIHALPQRVWEALSDVGALHTRLAAGFVAETRMDGNARIVTFVDGTVVREQIVDHADGTRFVWTTDLLPDEFAPHVDTMMTAGIAAIKRTIEGA